MPIYTLYLSTLMTSGSTSPFNPIIPINKTNLYNVSWNIDWSNLFKGQEKNYKFCRVRFNLLTQSTPSAASAWDNHLGYLTCNLPSSFSLTGQNTILGQLYMQDCPTTGTTTHCIIVNTLTECGVDINIPSNNSNIFTLSMMNEDAQSFNISYNYEYEIQLSFELYN